MDRPNPPAVFVGDLDDPWVAAIAAALPGGTIRVACSGSLPEAWPAGSERAPLLVLHRAFLSGQDADRVARARHGGWTPKTVLCVGPHARYHQVQRWVSGLVDVVVPEAVAAAVIARHVEDDPRRRPRGGPMPSLAVVSGQYECRAVLTEIGRAASYPTRAFRDWSEVPAGGLAVWDVPILEPTWPDELASQARGRRLVALLGFADRESVSVARRAAAAACLDAACEPADLVFVLDRLATSRLEPGHVLPPAPARSRRMAKAPADP
jgi:hypothetical protein